MKTPAFTRIGRWCIVLAGATLIRAAGAQEPPPAAPVQVIEVKPVSQRPGKLFQSRQKVIPREPEIIEIIEEDEARARARQGEAPKQVIAPQVIVVPEPRTESRSKSKPGKRGETTYLVEPEVVAVPAEAPPTAEPPQSPPKTTVTKTTTKTSKPAPEKQEVAASTTTTKAKSSTRRSSPSSESIEKPRSDDTKQQIKELEERVTTLQKELASTKESPPSAPTPAGTTPLTFSTNREERIPVVTSTPEPPPPPPPAPVTTGPRIIKTTTQKTEKVQEEPPVEKVRPTTDLMPPSEPAPEKVTVKKTTIAPSKPEAVDTVASDGDVPVAEKTDKPGIVKSPFPPHNIIDVIGMRSGSLAREPVTQRVFRVP